MAASLGQLTLDLVARIGGFTGPLNDASRQAGQRMAQIGAHAKAAGKAIGAASAVAAGAGAVWIKSSIDTAAEIEQLARVAGTSTTEFQKFAAGSQTVGIEQDKLSDILKDVNDRVGDFLTTGGGPMADFFEKVAPKIGVTAEQFKNLSGPQALGLYVDTLQKAGANQQEMTFFMEAMASDAAALVPLLLNGGLGMKSLATEAENLGLILSEQTIKNAAKFNKDLDLLGNVASSVGQQVAAELLPDLLKLTDTLRDPETAKAAADMAKAIVSAFTTVIEGAREMVGFVKWAGEETAVLFGGIGLHDVDRLEGEVDKLQGLMAKVQGEGFGPGTAIFDNLLGDFEENRAKLDQAYELLDLADNLNKSASAPPAAAGLGAGLGITSDDKPKSKDKSADKAINSARKLAEEITNQVAALEQQALMVGMSADAVTLYSLAQDGATDSQLKQAAAALGTVSAYEDQAKAIQAVASAQEQANAEAALILDSLMTEEDQIKQSYERRRQTILDSTIGTGEERRAALVKLEEQQAEELLQVNGSFWERYLEAAEENLESFDELAGSMLENFSGQFGDAFEAMVFDAETLGDAVSGMAEGMARSVVNAIGQMAAQWLAYEAVQLIVGKTTQASAATTMAANASAMAVTAGLNAFASTAAIPIVGAVAAPAAAAAALAITVPMASAVGALALAGMAHDGIDSVPQTGTWLLQKGERVTTAETSAKLDRTLANIQAGRQPESGGQTVHLNIDMSGVTNAREAKEASGVAARRVTRALANAGRYS